MSTAKPNKIELAKYLKEKRLAANLSQINIAHRLGYGSAQFISNWERGVARPPVSAIKKIAEVLRVPADEIFEIVLRAEIARVTEDLTRKFWGTKKK